MRRRDKELSKGWGQIAAPLWIQTGGGHKNTPAGDAVAFCDRMY